MNELNPQSVSDSATRTTVRACASCTFWESKDQAEGTCRRNAPQAVVFEVEEGTVFHTLFPETAATDWCGEYKQR